MGIISLIKPLKKYEDYFYRAHTYEYLFLRNKSIQIMNSAVNHYQFSKAEKSSGLIYLGILYSKSKEYRLAADSYHKALELTVNEDFKYSSNFKKVIETFIKVGDLEGASFWLNNLLERQNYDKRFKKLIVLANKDYEIRCGD